MTKKLSRREFLKGTGKVSAALAAIWMVGADLPPEEIDTPCYNVKGSVVYGDERDRDIWNEECYPYHWYPPEKTITWDRDGNALITRDGGKTWERL